ncbi:MAG: poly-beta-1,6-N-acetyl-D-glucosamine biosynthesis protein PgaD [Methylotenera sp.]|uniref:poly-beta-1,6-N-acetyl-D-glucosamine biosynthesis protein PgaD n=1 Tax=Methylotenera sp. TaxID=2051956 RepID=UPI00180EC1F9|nr:poly-beta-1,6-N-acetyl-D-glucosamine biosynthesis protein PgaD [Methylotenera sp.]NOU24493.1 poly-beta-1,6-N-acetyl-D-glucosamine biosynthesis protein PgaD [Methylotenera sp.]
MTRTLIIEKPELQSQAHRYGWSSITFLFWLLYIYLWLPFITLVAWWVGVELFHLQMVELNGYAGIVEKLGLYSAIVVIISIVLIGWAKIERYRFKDSIRRNGYTTVPVGEVAKVFELQESQLTELRKQKSVIVHFFDNGKLASVADSKLTM